MATVHREIPIDSTVDAAWKKLSDVGGVHGMLSILSGCSISGDKRVCELQGGGTLEELIISVDDDQRRVAYSITESPFGFEFHSASMSVLANGDKATFVWITDLKPDEGAEQFAGLVESETDNIKAFFAAS